MTDIEQALTEALEEWWPDVEEETGVSLDYAEGARLILATEPMQAIAREAAVGRARRARPEGAQAMTDIEQALAEALAIATAGEASPEQHIKAWRAHQETLLPFESLKTRRMAEDVMAQEPMQAIAREAAVGRAVLRLADSVAWTLRGGPDGSNTEAWNTQTGAVGSGDTIPEAIAAALRGGHR